MVVEACRGATEPVAGPPTTGPSNTTAHAAFQLRREMRPKCLIGSSRTREAERLAIFLKVLVPQLPEMIHVAGSLGDIDIDPGIDEGIIFSEF